MQQANETGRSGNQRLSHRKDLQCLQVWEVSVQVPLERRCRSWRVSGAVVGAPAHRRRQEAMSYQVPCAAQAELCFSGLLCARFVAH